jgi:hypothetical protein
MREVGDRDTHPAKLIQREVLDKRRRALVIYGDQHLTRTPEAFRSGCQAGSTIPCFPGSIVDQVERNAPPPPAHNGMAYWIKVTAQQDGSFVGHTSVHGDDRYQRRPEDDAGRHCHVAAAEPDRPARDNPRWASVSVVSSSGSSGDRP